VDCVCDVGGNAIPNPVQTFEQAFRPYPEILEEICKQNFEVPTPIQCQAWPVLLKGYDLIGIAQTGTGKTLTFLLPALIHIDRWITLVFCFWIVDLNIGMKLGLDNLFLGHSAVELVFWCWLLQENWICKLKRR
jgi:hypothetical protein